MSYMKEYMLDQVYKLGEKAGLTLNEAEDIYLNICDGDFKAYCDSIDGINKYRELDDVCLIQNSTESMPCEKDI